jgi:hypothetical protein
MDSSLNIQSVARFATKPPNWMILNSYTFYDSMVFKASKQNAVPMHALNASILVAELLGELSLVCLTAGNTQTLIFLLPNATTCSMIRYRLTHWSAVSLW